MRGSQWRSGVPGGAFVYKDDKSAPQACSMLREFSTSGARFTTRGRRSLPLCGVEQPTTSRAGKRLTCNLRPHGRTRDWAWRSCWHGEYRLLAGTGRCATEGSAVLLADRVPNRIRVKQLASIWCPVLGRILVTEESKYWRPLVQHFAEEISMDPVRFPEEMPSLLRNLVPTLGGLVEYYERRRGDGSSASRRPRK